MLITLTPPPTRKLDYLASIQDFKYTTSKVISQGETLNMVPACPRDCVKSLFIYLALTHNRGNYVLLEKD